MRLTMKLAIYASALALTLATNTPSYAAELEDDSHQNNIEQEIGLGTGSVIGGIIAGPPGVIAGAVIGNLMGQNIENENTTAGLQEQNQQLENALKNSKKQLQALKQDASRKTLVLNDTHLTIERLIKENQELKNHALNFDVQFRTNSIDIEKQYKKHLADLATALHTTPNMEVEVAGYTDRMGDENYNMELSKQRAEHVKEYLVQHGIEKERITTLAHGESQPLHPEENLENNFFDRRVSVYLRPIELGTENIAKEVIATEKNREVASKINNSKEI